MFCTRCGAANAEEASCCQQCGQPLPAAAPVSTTTPPLAGASESEQTSSSSAGQEAANRADRKPASEATLSHQLQPPASHTSGIGISKLPAGSGTTARSQMVSDPARTQSEWPLRTLVAQGIMPLRRDQASMVMLIGCAAGVVGFFLPWIQLDGFDPLLPAHFSISGPNFGLTTWLLLLALVLQAALAAGESWFLKNNPRLVVWLPALPLIIGSFVLAIAVYTLGIGFRLEGLLDLVRPPAGSMPTEAGPNIGIGPGTYLTLLGSLIVLGSGAYRLARLLLQARFPQ
ncbi:zinc ribbon domain-containing protein [Thermogemmatispora carboxidivorans]|uniref:zinc ribbon domain-containing protein n=1 Tax=Thermogemmatispora carboxidivorans TaxID=1382306 RepID=UPI0012DBFDE4|nr:zinc ribbon domain-containing protein [Thermogemmatispora carboxidivorans]